MITCTKLKFKNIQTDIKKLVLYTNQNNIKLLKCYFYDKS